MNGSDAGRGDPIVVVGAGVAGLGAALALSRAGHRVTLIERDATPLPADPDAAFDWDRRGAPQVRHSHALLARLRNLLRDRYPDVLESLLAAGATEIRFADNLPVDIVDRDPRPGDDDLVALACRRTTFEWVLRRTVLATDAVTLRHGVTVDGLEVEVPPVSDESTAIPRVRGVRLHRVARDPGSAAVADPGDSHGRNSSDGTEPAEPEIVPASMVVAALGRRSAVPTWLDEIGLHPEEQVEDTGIIYLSRFYRLRPGVESPATDGPIGGDLGYLKFAVFQGDNRTLSVTFALDADDRELRTRLVDPADFDRAATALEATRPWVDPEVTEAITDVHTMGGLINRAVSFVDDEGRPILLGFHAVGDAHTCTNPLYGRGCSLAMVQATLLADALADHPGEDDNALVARALAYEASSEHEIRPWYRASVNQDRLNREAALIRARDIASAAAEPATVDADPAERPDRADRAGDTEVADVAERASTTGRTAPPADDDQDQGRVARDFMRSIMRDGLMPAVRTDATVFRAFVRAFNLLDPPELITTDPDVVNRVLAAYQSRDERPAEPALGPDRHELLAVLATS